MQPGQKSNALIKPQNQRLGAAALLFGSLSIVFSLTSYYFSTNNLVVGPSTDSQLQAGALAALVLFTIGLFLVLFSGHLLLSTSIPSSTLFDHAHRSKLAVVSIVLSDRPYTTIFATAATIYGLIFAFFSGTLVYSPSISFSAEYSVSIPSAFLITCCDPAGQSPRLVVYLTEHLGVLLVPLNVLLIVAASWMVGANTSLAVFSFRCRDLCGKAGWGWLGSFGATTGLFTACPTCASLVILGSLGSGEAVAAVVAPAQSILIIVTILLLIGNLLFMSSRFNSATSCTVQSVEDC